MIDETNLTPQGENLKPKPERRVRMGEWFKPFEQYDDLPHDTDKPGEHSKGFRFKLDGIGRLEVSAYYRKDHGEFGGTSEKPITVILPDGDRQLSVADL